jgi:hypothetical protein
VHAALPVRVSLGRSAGWIACVALCAGFAATNLAAWLLLHNDAPLSAAVVLGSVTAVLTAWRLHRTHTTADLNWNGSEWQWQGLFGQAHVVLDLDAWMLLRFDPVQGRRRWIAASRHSATGPWPALRAALYARRPADLLPAPPP